MDDASASGGAENEAEGASTSQSENCTAKTRDKKVSRKNSDLSCKSKRSVRRKLKTFSFGKWQKGLNKDKTKKRTFTLDRETCRSSSSIVSESSIENVTCICTGYRKTKVIADKTVVSEETCTKVMSKHVVLPIIDSSPIHNSTDDVAIIYQDTQNETVDTNNERPEPPTECVYEPPPHQLSPTNRPFMNEIELTEFNLALMNHLCFQDIPEQLMLRYADLGALPSSLCRPNVFGQAHTQIDYVHHLVPKLLEITNCSFYWGQMDRYKAEKELDKKPEGTFLLRDSAQEEYLFSVSFRRYGRTLHARIEQLNHNFSFDSHDPNVFASPTVCGLLEHYKNPRCCMFFEPMLTIPVHRKFPFDLQHLCRSVIADTISYNNINLLKLPKKIKSYLKEYHYKQKVRVRHLENDV